MHLIPERNPLATPTLAAALIWLQPCVAPMVIESLIRRGRIPNALALSEAD
jgi:hypothetical protein